VQCKCRKAPIQSVAKSNSNNIQLFWNFNSYHENLTVGRVPVLLPGMFPRYFELGPFSVEPAQSRNIVSVYQCYQPRPKTLSACNIRLSHFRFVKWSTM